MSARAMITVLTAAALGGGTALISTAASAAGGHGGPGNWPQEGTYNWPVYASHTCHWAPVKYYDHGRPYLRQVWQCP